MHAPDIEIALMNARDVFVRRPQCASLWIVPAEAMTSRTRQELAAEGQQEEQLVEKNQPAYYVFAKHKPAGTQVLVGEIQAGSPESALWKAQSQLEGYRRRWSSGFAQSAAVFQSAEADADSLFSSALDKPYRMATDFHTVTIMRQIRKEGWNHR